MKGGQALRNQILAVGLFGMVGLLSYQKESLVFISIMWFLFWILGQFCVLLFDYKLFMVLH